MVTLIKNLPDRILGLRFSGQIEKNDYENVVIPAFEEQEAKFGKIDCLIVYDSSIKNFTAGALVDDFKTGIKYLKKWNKVAIVSSKQFLEKLAESIFKLIPGECKGFSMEEMEQAKAWVTKSN